MSDSLALSESERGLANVLEIGIITEVDAAKSLAKMDVGGAETDWLPWAVARAGTTRTASAPAVGEQRILFAPQGDLTQAVIGPAIYQEDHDNPATSEKQHVVVFPDETRLEYDEESTTLAVTLAEGGALTIICTTAAIQAEESVTIDAPEANFTGNVTIGGSATIEGDLAVDGGSVTHGGTNIGKDHKHGGVESGGSQTSGPS